MIFLITAVPGSGKSLTAVEMIFNYLKQGRKVYTNVPLVTNDDGSFLIGDGVYPIPDHNDFLQLPVGSVVIFDEAHEIFPATGKAGLSVDERITALTKHRHDGYDIVFITQDATFLHHDIRKLVGTHIHLYRGHGSSVVSRYTWSHYCASPNDRKEQERATAEMWRFPKDLYQYYKSSQVHTHKFNIPRKGIFIGVLILSIVFYIVYSVFFGGGLDFINSASQSSQALVSPSSSSSSPSNSFKPSVQEDKQLPKLIDVIPDLKREFLLSTAPTAEPLEGCIHYKDNCHCYNKKGLPLEVSVSMCKMLLSKPLPRQLPISQKGV